MTTILHTSFTSSASGQHVEDFNRWCNGVWRTHRVERHPNRANPAPITCTALQFGPLLVIQSTNCAMERQRTLAHIADDHFDHYGLHIQESGVSSCTVDDCTVRMNPGEIRIVDLAQPETVATSGGTSTTLYILRDRIDAAIPDFHLRHGSVLQGEGILQLASFVTSIPAYVQSIPPHGLRGYVDAALTYLVSALLASEHLDDAEVRRNQSRQAVIAHIEANLGDPDLSPRSISHALAISRSALYRLFPQDGGIARYIKLRRLRRVRQAIQGEMDFRSIGQISSEVGFTSATQFWRAFTQEYGYPPGHLRMQTRRATTAPDSIAALLRAMYQADNSLHRVAHAVEPYPLVANQGPATSIAS